MDKLNKVVKDAGDTLKEGSHRSEAGAEHAKRDVAGDAMTPGEKAGSMAHEVGEDAKAEVDKLKREGRDAT